MVGRSEDLIRSANFKTAVLQELECVTGAIVHNVAPHMQQALTIGPLQNGMRVPDLLVERFAHVTILRAAHNKRIDS